MPKQVHRLRSCCVAVLSLDMVDTSGESDTDSEQTGAIEHMKLYKERLKPNGKPVTHGRYKAPVQADAIAIVGNMLVTESRKVRK